jgi:hypothetical protein
LFFVVNWLSPCLFLVVFAEMAGFQPNGVVFAPPGVRPK